MHTTTRAPSVALLLPVLALVAAAPATAQSFPSDTEVRRILQERVAAGGAVGIAVGLLEADGTTRTIAVGSAGAGARPIGPETVFEIGSITKVFTGTLLADMVRRGEVSLDDPVERYLPDGVTMPTRDGVEITLEDLATHRSALPRIPGNMAPADPSNPYVDYTADMMYDFLSTYELPRAIGSEFEYSNLAVGLLGHVLARRLGTTYEDAVRDRILEPLGMESTGVALTPEMQAAMAKGHDAAGDTVSLWDIGTLAGAGALRSDVDDMLRFLEANVGEPTTEVERAMRDAHRVRSPMNQTMDVGLNWITRTTGEQRTVWHNGGTGGFRTFAGFDPDAEVAVVVLTNSAIGADDIGFHLLNAEIALAPPSTADFSDREEVEVDHEILQRYVGEYEVTPQVIATLTLEDGRLHLQVTGQPRFPVFAASDTVFFLRVVAAEMEFVVDGEGDVTGMVLRQAGQTVRADKVR